MANSSYEIKKIIVVYEPTLTEIYVEVNAIGDSPINIQGWHHKTFPDTISLVAILQGIADGSIETFIMWPLDAPHSVLAFNQGSLMKPSVQ